VGETVGGLAPFEVVVLAEQERVVLGDSGEEDARETICPGAEVLWL
jgi:hypothetical protein